ncbi:hypothetical protein [Blautia sp.]|uniref:hypothetical protein n=1 Tax=Blautia sp. TaxID=1955243 RepID=UPI002E772A57|nr:hypothetical protein [Blautia sp.]
MKDKKKRRPVFKEKCGGLFCGTQNTFLLHFEFISHIIIIMCLREKEKGAERYEVEEI